MLFRSFASADLQQSIFHKASCVGASFIGANLTCAELNHADLTRCNFTGATLFRARLHQIKDEDAVFGASRAVALGDDPDLAEAENFRPRY